MTASKNWGLGYITQYMVIRITRTTNKEHGIKMQFQRWRGRGGCGRRRGCHLFATRYTAGWPWVAVGPRQVFLQFWITRAMRISWMKAELYLEYMQAKIKPLQTGFGELYEALRCTPTSAKQTWQMLWEVLESLLLVHTACIIQGWSPCLL